MRRKKAADAGENDAEAKTQAKRQRTESKGDVRQEEEIVAAPLSAEEACSAAGLALRRCAEARRLCPLKSNSPGRERLHEFCSRRTDRVNAVLLRCKQQSEQAAPTMPQMWMR